MAGKKIMDFESIASTDIKDDDWMLWQPRAEKTKRLSWVGLYTAVMRKMAEFVFNNLETKEKTITGAINELDAASKRGKIFNFTDLGMDGANPSGTIGTLLPKIPDQAIFFAWIPTGAFRDDLNKRVNDTIMWGCLWITKRNETCYVEYKAYDKNKTYMAIYSTTNDVGWTQWICDSEEYTTYESNFVNFSVAKSGRVKDLQISGYCNQALEAGKTYTIGTLRTLDRPVRTIYRPYSGWSDKTFDIEITTDGKVMLHIPSTFTIAKGGPINAGFSYI